MTTPEQEDLGRTAPIQRPVPDTPPPPHAVDAGHAAPSSARAEEAAGGVYHGAPTEVGGDTGPYPASHDVLPPAVPGEAAPIPTYLGEPAVASSGELSAEAAPVARAAPAADRNLLYIPLAVTIGDGFKFGCGFFLASVLAMLVGFVLLSVLFVVTNLFGLSVPLGR